MRQPIFFVWRIVFGSLLALVASLFWINAAPTVVTLNGQSISLPAPYGFQEVSNFSAETQALGKRLTPKINKLLTLYLPSAEVAKFNSAKSASWDRYLMIQIEQQITTTTMESDEFQRIKNQVEVQQQTLLNQIKIDITQLHDNLDQDNYLPIDIPIGTSIPLGMFSESNSHLSMLSLNRYPAPDRGTYYVIASTNLVHMNANLFFAYVYSTYNSNLDMEWVKNTSIQWVDTLKSANPAETFLSTIDNWSVLSRSTLIIIMVAAMIGIMVTLKKRVGR